MPRLYSVGRVRGPGRSYRSLELRKRTAPGEYVVIAVSLHASEAATEGLNAVRDAANAWQDMAVGLRAAIARAETRERECKAILARAPDDAGSLGMVAFAGLHLETLRAIAALGNVPEF